MLNVIQEIGEPASEAGQQSVPPARRILKWGLVPGGVPSAGPEGGSRQLGKAPVLGGAWFRSKAHIHPNSWEQLGTCLSASLPCCSTPYSSPPIIPQGRHVALQLAMGIGKCAYKPQLCAMTNLSCPVNFAQSRGRLSPLTQMTLTDA